MRIHYTFIVPLFLSFVHHAVTDEIVNFGPLNDETIREAVALWFQDKDKSTANYGLMSEWDTSQVTSFEALFYRNDVTNNTFNEPIGMWQTGNVTTMRSMFFNCTSFNQDISTWNTSAVTSMRTMFNGVSSYNRHMLSWDTSKVENFEAMFFGCESFNQPIDNFDTSSATNLKKMFQNSAFNFPVSNFNTSQVTEFAHLFENCPFNWPLDNFDTSKARDMSHMFRNNTSFNQPLEWQTGTAIGMQEMFFNATSFDQSLCWNLTSIIGMFNADTVNMFCNSQGSWDPACHDIAPIEVREAAFQDCLNEIEVPIPSTAPNSFRIPPTRAPSTELAAPAAPFSPAAPISPVAPTATTTVPTTITPTIVSAPTTTPETSQPSATSPTATNPPEPTAPSSPTISPAPTAMNQPSASKTCRFCPVGTKISTPPHEYIYTSANGEYMTCGRLHYKMNNLENENECPALQQKAKHYCCSPQLCPLCPGGVKPMTHPHKHIFFTKHGEPMTCGKLHKKVSKYNKHDVHSGKCANVQGLAIKYCCPKRKCSKGSKSKKGSKSSKHSKHEYTRHYKPTKEAKGHSPPWWYRGH